MPSFANLTLLCCSTTKNTWGRRCWRFGKLLKRPQNKNLQQFSIKFIALPAVHFKAFKKIFFRLILWFCLLLVNYFKVIGRL
jgi:hypothetical protein